MGQVSQPEEASESAGPVWIQSGWVGGWDNGRGADSEDASAEGSSVKLAQADSDQANQTERTGKAPSAHERRRQANLAGQAASGRPGPERTQQDKRR